MASSDSSAPFGLPGRLTMRVRPRTPTTPRDRSASGRDRAARGAHRLGEARDLVVDDGRRRLRRHVARRQAGPAGRDDQVVVVGALDERGLDRRAARPGRAARSTVKPRSDSRAPTRAPEVSSRTPAAAPSLAVMTRADRAKRVAHRAGPCASTTDPTGDARARAGRRGAPSRVVRRPLAGPTFRSCRRSSKRGGRPGSRRRVRRP